MPYVVHGIPQRTCCGPIEGNPLTHIVNFAITFRNEHVAAPLKGDNREAVCQKDKTFRNEHVAAPLKVRYGRDTVSND